MSTSGTEVTLLAAGNIWTNTVYFDELVYLSKIDCIMFFYQIISRFNWVEGSVKHMHSFIFNDYQLPELI